MPRIVIFLDLDDTILQTAPKCPPGEPVEPAAVDRAGRRWIAPAGRCRS